MWHTRYRWIVASSASLLSLVVVHAARRPHYGGELRIETRASIESPDPAVQPSDSAGRALKAMLLGQVFETLVRIDEHGRVQPWLATAWTHDAAKKCWTFTPRANVILQDGSVWTPPDGIIAVPDDQPIEEILRRLSRPESAIVIRSSDGTLTATGPFRIAHWDPGKAVRLEAHENYWRGRPFLDAVEIRMRSGLRDRLLDLDLAKTDVAEVPLTDVRRLRQQGTILQLSKPSDTLALFFVNPQIPETTRQALSLAIDGSAIERVLLDREGVISGALLPQWLTGYAFLFRAERDLNRAKTLARGAPPLKLGYDREDPLTRAIAERIIVNAAEAGLTLRSAEGAGDVRLRRLPLMSLDARQALDADAAMLGLSLDAAASPYDAERALLKDFRVIPLFHVPLMYALRSNVRNWTSDWRLDDVWIEPARKP